MKKLAFIVLSFLLCMFSLNDVINAEEGVCSYEIDMPYNPAKIYGEDNNSFFTLFNNPVYFSTFEFRIFYDENDYRVEMLDKHGEYTPNYLNGLVLFDDNLTYTDWMNVINKNNQCPYYVYIGMEGTMDGNNKIFVQPKEYGFFSLPIYRLRGFQNIAVCKNCDVEDFDPLFSDKIEDCSSLIGPNVMYMLNNVMNYIKIIVPVLVIALGTFDFVRAVLSPTEEDMKKIQKTFIRRLIIAVIIFMSPYFVNLIIQITNSIAGFSNGGTCGIL